VITPKSFTESLMFSTLRVETRNRENTLGVGTGFFFETDLSDERVLQLLITNRHVVEGAITGTLRFHLAKSSSEFTPSGETLTLVVGEPSVPFAALWVPHPDPDVDLCALPLSGLFGHLRAQKKRLYFQSVDKSFTYDDESLNALTAVENVLMVGYPIGLDDDVHSLPLVRSGITATHPAIDYRGKRQGVVDMACFPGSSGSPVFLYDSGVYFDKPRGSMKTGSRQALLGVLFAAPHHTREGTIVVRDIPTAATKRVPVPITSSMSHLGYYIKATEVVRLAEHVRARSQTPGPLAAMARGH
jgi:hypothetical protein